MKILQAGDPQYKRYHFTWTLTNWCNYDCSYCCEKSIMIDRWDRQNSISTYKLTLSRLKRFDASFIVDLYGGEPTLHPHMDDILTELCAMPLCDHVDVITNLSRPLSYFASLDIPAHSKTRIVASFHPEYNTDDFIKKVISIYGMQFLQIAVTVNISDDPKHWPATINVIEELAQYGIVCGLHFLNSTDGWISNYTSECYEVFKRYQHNTYNTHKYLYDGGEVVYTDLQVYQQGLHKFKGYRCEQLFYDIKFDGSIVNTCTRVPINSIMLKKRAIEGKEICPNECCSCEAMLNAHKVLV